MLTKKINFSLPFRLAFIYFFIGGLYIIISDTLLEKAVSTETLTRLQSYKGLVFVLATSIILYFLIKRSLKRIKKGKQKYRLLADHSKDLICLHGSNARFIYLSPSLKELLGYSIKELLGKNPHDYVHPNDLDRVNSSFHQLLLNEKKSYSITYRVKKKSGEYIWFETAHRPILKNDDIMGMVSSSRDVTERVESNKEIKAYQKSLQNLTSEILLVEEKQRKEIAANIHDHLSQSLVISKMKLQDLRKKEAISKYWPDIDFAVSHITEALENSRKITSDLCPPVLYQLGIIDTMHWLSDKIEEQYKIKVTFNTNTEHIKLEDKELITIYRSVQEIITNTIKHANATKITIDFKLTSEGLDILVSDNGIGFNVEKIQKNKVLNNGFGLFKLKERIQNLGGTVRITSKPVIKTGTTVNIFLYLK